MISNSLGDMNKLLIATTNLGKFLEYREFFKDFPVELISLENLNINTRIDEKEKTFEGNAVLKAKIYRDLSGFNTLSDDGGLEIDFLKKEPGVKSRRWPGYEANDQELVTMVLDKLKGVPISRRGAQLKVVLAFAFPNVKKIYTFEASLKGFITEKPSKGIIPGYPFRSLFYLPDIGKTLGDISFEEEARIGHRKMALEKAMPVISKHLLFKKKGKRK